MLLVSHQNIFYKPVHLAPYPLKADSQLPPFIFQQRTSDKRSSPHPHRAELSPGLTDPPRFKVRQSLKNKLFSTASLTWDQSWAKLKRLPGLTFLLCSILILNFIPLRTLEQELLTQALLLDINLAYRKFLRNIYWAEIQSTAIIKNY